MPVTITVNIEAASGLAHVVNFGLPLQRGEFRLSENRLQLGVEYKASPLIFWPDGSVRVMRVQVRVTGRTVLTCRVEQGTQEPGAQFDPVTPGDTHKGQVLPSAIAIVDPNYLAGCGIVPAFTPAGNNVFDSGYLPTMFANHSASADYEDIGAAGWLFDRASANLLVAMRSGELEHYREAYAAFRFWNSKLQTTDFCRGGLDMDGLATPFPYPGRGCDGKFIYVQPIFLFAAVFGELDPLVPVDEIADTAWRGSDSANMEGFNRPYENLNAWFTERDAGTALQAQVSAYEITLNAVYLGRCVVAISNLYTMITANPDGEGSHGYASHSWSRCEYGWVYNPADPKPPPFSGSEDRVFSPWMQCCIADPLWQLYQLIESSQLKIKIAELLLGFGEAIAMYGVDAARMPQATRQAIENAYNVKLFDPGHTRHTRCADGQPTRSPYVRYVANHLLADPQASQAYIEDYDRRLMIGEGYGSDQHTPEALFQVALAFHFQQDAEKRAALKMLADDMATYFEPAACTARASLPPRSFNWQMKANPWGTYQQLIDKGNTMPDWLPNSESDLYELVYELPLPEPHIHYPWLCPIVDYTGNGQNDVIIYSHHWQPFSPPVDDTTTIAWLYEGGEGPEVPLNRINWPFHIRHPLFKDFNNDGILDAQGGPETDVTGDVFIGAPGGQYTHDPAIESYDQPLTQNDDFEIVTTWPADIKYPTGYYADVQPQHTFWVDLDGDGTNERIILLHGYTKPEHRTYIFKFFDGDWHDISDQLGIPNMPGAERLLIPIDQRQVGYPDLIDAMTGDIWLNNGGGQFTLSQHRLFPQGRSAPFFGDGDIQVRDLTNNGYPDLVLLLDHGSDGSYSGTFINKGTPEGEWQEISGYIIGSNARYCRFGDLFGQGTVDMAVWKDQWSYPANTLRIYRNKTPNPGCYHDVGFDDFGPQIEYVKDGQVVYREQSIQYTGGGRGLVISSTRHVGGVDSVDSINVIDKTNNPLQDEAPPPPPVNQAPTVSILSPVAGVIPDTTGEAGEVVSFNCDHHDTDGTVVNVEWKLDGQVVGNTDSFDLLVDDGQHQIEVTVTDDDGATASAVINFTVEAPQSADLVDRQAVMSLVDQANAINTATGDTLRSDIENL